MFGAGCGIRLYQFLIIAFLSSSEEFTLWILKFELVVVKTASYFSRCSSKPDEKTTISSRYTRQSRRFISPMHHSIRRWKPAGALQSPNGIRLNSKFLSAQPKRQSCICILPQVQSASTQFWCLVWKILWASEQMKWILDSRYCMRIIYCSVVQLPEIHTEPCFSRTITILLEYRLFFFLADVFIALKGIHVWFLFAFTAVGVVQWGGRKMSPRTTTIVQFIFYVWSFEISVNILRNQKLV